MDTNLRYPRLLRGLIGSLLLAAAVAQAAGADDASLEARARQIHSKVLTIDTHVDVLLPETPKRYYDKDGKSAADVAKLKAGGVDAIALAIAVGPGPRNAAGDAQAKAEADQKVKAIQAFVSDSGGAVALARSADDIERLHREGKIAVIPSFLNARSLGGKLDGIDTLYQQGVRIFAFTHAGNNAFADSSRPSTGEKVEHKGLSPLGKQAVAKLNNLGVVIDVAQLTPDGVFQVLQLTKAPVIASHTAARALVDNTRNLSDAELDAIKKNGGVVHVTPFNPYLAKQSAESLTKIKALRDEYGLKGNYDVTRNNYTEGYEALSKERQDQYVAAIGKLQPVATLQNYIDHIDYIAKRIGVEHVGIGADFNHGAGVEGFRNEADAFNVTRELVKRGYNEEQIAKIWGGNFLRVFRAVEKAAQAQRT
ncbi:dipeptidase [Steroidobacter sp.]|uniref:dipeptidase n=1 Tax=Steroidobacter sp. TaxID=1978227 RepID=UPI001A5A58B3|nr:dipeptidase [Steroidobacter sp.]MBL8269331.1 dipeptidase [Steroidobacter sp.]